MCRACQQPGQWEVVQGSNPNEMTQVRPLGDLKKHHFKNCPCIPQYTFFIPEGMTTAVGVVTHTSFDDRERFIDQSPEP